MGIDSQRRRWSDHRKIDIMDPRDRLYWTKFFGIEEGDLFEAVDKVGTSAEKVRHYLVAGRLRHWTIGGRDERRHPLPARRQFE